VAARGDSGLTPSLDIGTDFGVIAQVMLNRTQACLCSMSAPFFGSGGGVASA